MPTLVAMPSGGGDLMTGVSASVIVPTHGGMHRLETLLRALSLQCCDDSWEVVVVVDGVVDDTVELLRQWDDRLHLSVLVFPQNRGVVAALNGGYEAAVGRVLIRCDDDLTPAADFVQRHLAWHSEGGPRRGVIGLTRNVFPPTSYALAYGWRADARARSAAYAAPASRRWRHWAANNSVDRRTWELVGGFDPAFRYGEDSEFGWRIAQSGAELLVDPHLETEHRGPATLASVRLARGYVSGASRRRFADTHPAAEPHDEELSDSLSNKVWLGAVRRTAAVLTNRDRCRRLGHGIDRLLPLVPLELGWRIVSLGLEAAAAAGYRDGPSSDELPQKALELAVERQQPTS